MKKKDMTELRRTMTPDRCSISRVCGCLVNGMKEKVLTFQENFLDREEQDILKYLKITKKLLSNKIGNNSLISEFPMEEELSGERYSLLTQLRESKLKNEDLLQRFYDNIIELYPSEGTFLILLFHDCYDILDDKDCTGCHDYIMCAVCPMALTADVLGYNQGDDQISQIPREFAVCPPDAGFTFPAFTDRETDVHAIHLYVKDARCPKTDFLSDLTGCQTMLTADQKKDKFLNIGAYVFDEQDDSMHMIVRELYRSIEEDECENLVTPQAMREILTEALNDADLESRFMDAYEKEFASETVYIRDLIDDKMVEAAYSLERKNRLKVIFEECVKIIEDTKGEIDLTKEIKDTYLL